MEVKRRHPILDEKEKEEIHNKLRSFLYSQGLKATPERFAVLDEIYTTDFHFEAEDILMRMMKKKQRVSRATIYRTLEILEKCGLIRKAKLGETTAYYEHTYGRHHHEHMKCTSCGKIIEFESEDIERLQDMICKQFNFKMTYHILHMFGVCEDCQKSGAAVPTYANPYV
ncbi:transcriptional repressor [bacterium]|nr:transcriptional repressor [bacterium]